MGFLFSGSGRAQKQPTIYSTVRVQNSAQGVLIPILHGRNALPGDLIWYGSLFGLPITQSSGGGKGGGGTITTGYTYYVPTLWGVAEGPLDYPLTVFQDSSVLGFVSGENTDSPNFFAAGTQGQAPYGLLPAPYDLSYSSTALLGANRQYLGDNPSMPNIRSEWQGSIGGAVREFYTIGSGSDYSFAPQYFSLSLSVTEQINAPGAPPYQYQAINPDGLMTAAVSTGGVNGNLVAGSNSSGVLYADTGIPFTQVSSSPGEGEYSVTKFPAGGVGLYTFSAADAGDALTVIDLAIGDVRYCVQTAGTLNGTAAVSSITTTDISVGNIVLGAGIAPGTAVQAIGTNSLTLSQPATVSATETLTFLGTPLTQVLNAPLGQGEYYVSVTAQEYGVFVFSYADDGATVCITDIPDADPSQSITDFLTNERYGCGLPTALIGDLSLFQSYSFATGMLISPTWAQQQTGADSLKTIAQGLNSEFRWSSGLLTLVPYGDLAITANGYTYTPPTPVTIWGTLGDDDFMKNEGTASVGVSSFMTEDPVVVYRQDPTTQLNDLKVEYLDRGNSYNPAIAEAQNDAAIQLYGLRPADKRTHHFFCFGDAASMSAQLQLNRQAVRNLFTFTVPWYCIALDPMDLIEIEDAALGIVPYAPVSYYTAFDPDALANGQTLSANDLTVSYNGTKGMAQTVDAFSTGKYYFEFTMNFSSSANADYCGVIGYLCDRAFVFAAFQYEVYLAVRPNGEIIAEGSIKANLGALSTGVVIGVAADPANNAFWFRANGGNWNGSGTADPTAGSGSVSVGNGEPFTLPALFFALTANAGDSITLNAGATPFSGAVPSGFTSGLPSSPPGVWPCYPAFDPNNTSTGGAAVTLSNDNHTATATGGSIGNLSRAFSTAYSPGRSVGKYYLEFTTNSSWSESNGQVGFYAFGGQIGGGGYIGKDQYSVGISSTGAVQNNTTVIGTGAAIPASTLMGVAVDFGAQQIWYRVGGGNWNNNALADPVTGVGGFSFAGAFRPMTPAFLTNTIGVGVTINSGDSAFTGAVPAGYSGFNVCQPVIVQTPRMVRIREITENQQDLSLTITAEDYLQGSGSVPQLNPGQSAPVNSVGNGGSGGAGSTTNTAPNDAIAPIMFEPPTALRTGNTGEVWLLTGQSANWGAADVYISLDGGETYNLAISTGARVFDAKMGELATRMLATADPDTTDAVSVDFAETGSTPATAAQAAADAFATLSFVGTYPAPAVPLLSSTAGGSIAQKTYYGKITLFFPEGEGPPSGEASLTVAADNLLVVDSPDAQSEAWGWRFYGSTTSGTEVLQTPYPIPFGTAWTLPTSGLVTGTASPPAINYKYELVSYSTATLIAPLALLPPYLGHHVIAPDFMPKRHPQIMLHRCDRYMTC